MTKSDEILPFLVKNKPKNVYRIAITFKLLSRRDAEARRKENKKTLRLCGSAGGF